MSTEEKRAEFLKILRDSYPTMPVICVKKYENDYRWPTERLLGELDLRELEEVNLRKTRPNEIIFDIEDPKLLHILRNQFDLRQWNYEVWQTGSRGYHVSVLFDNLADLELELRNRIRKHLIKEYNTDEALSKESHFLALEYTPHFKTGNEKYLFDKHYEEVHLNTIEESLIAKCREELNTQATLVEETNYIVDEEFKDFAFKDPYIKYVLSNKIEAGDRNNVLFKNLAIGLVKSGLDKYQRDKLITALVNNCPGKNIGEFQGWIEKALRGELQDYNKFEMVKWAIKYGYPVMYKTEEEIHQEELLTIKELWDAIWNSTIQCQPIWKDLAFYNLISTLIDERLDDYRIHVIFSSDPGSGKDAGLNLIQKILEDLGYNTSRPVSVTDRTLVGAVNQFAVEFNTKHGLSAENPVQGNKTYRETKQFGLLSNCHWMAFGESESVFRPGAHNRLIQSIVRQAMDEARTVERGVAGENIKIKSNTSFVLVTYPDNETIYKILHNGLFQRALYYNKDVTEDETKSIRSHIIKKLFNDDIKSHFPEKEYFALLEKKLKDMIAWYKEIPRDFKSFPNADKYIESLWAELDRSYSALPAIDKKILESIARRGAKNHHKLCVLKMISSKQTVLTKPDIDECFSLLNHCIESVKGLMAAIGKQDKRVAVLLHVLKSESKTITQIAKELKNQIHINSHRTIQKLLKQCIDVGIVSEYKASYETLYMLTDKGRDLIE